MRGVGQIEHDGRMRFCSSAIGVRPGEIDRAVEVQGTVRVDVDVQRLEVGRGVDQANIAGLHKVVGDDDVLLVRSDFDVMRANGRLSLVRVVEALRVAQVRDVECGDVVGRCECRCWELE